MAKIYQCDACGSFAEENPDFIESVMLVPSVMKWPTPHNNPLMGYQYPTFEWTCEIGDLCRPCREKLQKIIQDFVEKKPKKE